MQRTEFKNLHTLWHFDRTREITNNLIFMFATTTETNDKKFFLNDTVKKSLGWPESINTLYDYRRMFGDVYERIFQFCVISLCSDVEAFFKDTFDKFGYTKGSGSGFFQRFDDVIAVLRTAGYDFSDIDQKLINIRLAFQVRHIGIHNNGIVDQSFFDKTNTGTLGHTYPIDQEKYKEMFDSYVALLKHLDGQLPAVR
ncbi:hypothetical protein [Pseudomonas mosselii]|uniref:hypothetical protein n=1 Tax=Pseudomonas mosselii TaxID=78327 RepID=UPI00244D01E1|nr:hypothetical protein [Pseudomonas mosselii]MDH1530627.1 hypothetical protein [Pseudomonas mosselii]